jgi:hypothetical protein
MATKGYFAHTSPEGVTPWYWFAKAGYKFIYAGENLAVNYNQSQTVETAWLNSPTHRANIMNENFTEMGVATAVGEYNGAPATFVVELFGMPATPRVAGASASTPAPKVVQAPVKTPVQTQQKVAGKTVPSLTVLEETPTFQMAQNTDRTLEPGNPTVAPTPKISWIKRLILESDKIAGLIIQIIIIALIITTAGMVAREYEKHHRKHMAYGTLLAVVMFAFLFVGRLGIFSEHTQTASAPLQSSSLLQ